MTLTPEQITEVRERRAAGATYAQLAREYEHEVGVIRRAVLNPNYGSTCHRGIDWTQQRRDEQYSRKIAHRNRGVNAKLTPEQVIEICERLLRGERDVDIALSYGVSQATISTIRHRRRWRDLTENLAGIGDARKRKKKPAQEASNVQSRR